MCALIRLAHGFPPGKTIDPDMIGEEQEPDREQKEEEERIEKLNRKKKRKQLIART
jgi:hypothetical protein